MKSASESCKLNILKATWEIKIEAPKFKIGEKKTC